MNAQTARYCERCGLDLDLDLDLGNESGEAGEVGESSKHTCVGYAELEPPRYCGQCKRRMVVQITPSGWSARCSEHGTTNSGDAAAS